MIAVSGVLIFLAVSRFIDLNGLSKFAPLIGLVGIAMLFWADKVADMIPIKIIQKPLIWSISHVLVFIFVKSYLSQYLANYWVLFIIVGIILLNYNKEIARLLLRK